jgi:hypothetical protein
MDENKLNNIGKRLGDVSTLPPELTSQLQSIKLGEIESQILDVMNGLDGYANLDEILVSLYRKFGKVYDRKYISHKLYRMVHSGVVISVKGRKGVYTVCS